MTNDFGGSPAAAKSRSRACNSIHNGSDDSTNNYNNDNNGGGGGGSSAVGAEGGNARRSSTRTTPQHERLTVAGRTRSRLSMAGARSSSGSSTARVRDVR